MEEKGEEKEKGRDGLRKKGRKEKERERNVKESKRKMR